MISCNKDKSSSEGFQLISMHICELSDELYVNCPWGGSGSQMCSMGLAAMDTNLMDEPSKLVAVESIASGAILGTYEDTRFKSEVNLLLT